MKDTRFQDTAWMLLNATALLASLAHVLIDYTMGLYGKISVVMSPLQATTILLICLVYAYWMLMVGWASGGEKSALLSLLMLTLIWSLLANGIAGMAACPPLCSGAFPYQDIAHLASLIFGGLAAYTTWRKLRRTEGASGWWLPAYTSILLVATFVFQTLLTTPNI